MSEAPRLVDHLCEPCRRHFDTVLELLRRVGLDPVLDFRLVRGLDYYTRTTFEYQSNALGFAQSTIGGGGRYDGLVELIGGPPTPGFGFGSGLERVTLVAGLEEAEDEGPLAYVVSFVPESRADAFALAQHLRRDLLIDAECDLAGRSAKAQLNQAGRSGAELALLVGLDDLADGEVRLRDLESGDEEDVAHRRARRLVRRLARRRRSRRPRPPPRQRQRQPSGRQRRGRGVTSDSSAR